MLLPLYGAWGFVGKVVVDSGNFGDLHEAGGHGVEEFVRHGDGVGGHAVDGLHGAQDD